MGRAFLEIKLLLFLSLLPNLYCAQSKSQEDLKQEVFNYYTETSQLFVDASKKTIDGMLEVGKRLEQYDRFNAEFDHVFNQLAATTEWEKNKATMRKEVIDFLNKQTGTEEFSDLRAKLAQEIAALETQGAIIEKYQRCKNEIQRRTDSVRNWFEEKYKKMGVYSKFLEKGYLEDVSKFLKQTKKAKDLYDKFDGIQKDKFQSLRQIQIALEEGANYLPKPLNDMVGLYAKAVSEITSALERLDRQIQENIRQGFAELTSPEAQAWYNQFQSEYVPQKLTGFSNVEPPNIWMATAGDMMVYSFEENRFHLLGAQSRVDEVYKYYSALLMKVKAKLGKDIKIPLARFRKACQDPAFVKQTQAALDHYEEALKPASNPGSFLLLLNTVGEALGMEAKASLETTIRTGSGGDSTAIKTDEERQRERVSFQTAQSGVAKARELFNELNSLSNELDLENKLPKIKTAANVGHQTLVAQRSKIKVDDEKLYDQAVLMFFHLQWPEDWEKDIERLAQLFGVVKMDISRIGYLSRKGYAPDVRNAQTALGEASYYMERTNFEHLFSGLPEVSQNDFIRQYEWLLDTLKGLRPSHYSGKPEFQSKWREVISKDELFEKQTQGDLAIAREQLEKYPIKSKYPYARGLFLNVKKNLVDLEKVENSYKFKLTSFLVQDQTLRMLKILEEGDKKQAAFETAVKEYETKLPQELERLIQECKRARMTIKTHSAELCQANKKAVQELEQNQAVRVLIAVYNELYPKFTALSREGKKLSGKEGCEPVQRANSAAQPFFDPFGARNPVVRFYRAIAAQGEGYKQMPVFIEEGCGPDGNRFGSKLIWSASEFELSIKKRDGSAVKAREINEFALDLERQASFVKDPYYYISCGSYQDRPVSGGSGGGQEPASVSQKTVQEFYEKFCRAYSGANIGEILRMVSGSWYSSSGDNISDIRNNLEKSFSIYRNIQCQISNLSIIPSKFNKLEVIASYHLNISGELLQRPGIINQEEGDVTETLSLTKGGDLIILHTEGSWQME